MIHRETRLHKKGTREKKKREKKGEREKKEKKKPKREIRLFPRVTSGGTEVSRSLVIDAFFLMKGSGGWSDSLTCSIGGCRCRRGYRGCRSGISCRSSPLLLLPQRGLLPCLPEPVFLLQLQSETRIDKPLIKRCFRSIPRSGIIRSTPFSSRFKLSLNLPFVHHGRHQSEGCRR